MAEVVARMLLSIVLTTLVTTVVVLVAAPFVFIKAARENGSYLRNVGDGYRELIRRCYDFGTTFIQP